MINGGSHVGFPEIITE